MDSRILIHLDTILGICYRGNSKLCIFKLLYLLEQSDISQMKIAGCFSTLQLILQFLVLLMFGKQYAIFIISIIMFVVTIAYASSRECLDIWATNADNLAPPKEHAVCDYTSNFLSSLTNTLTHISSHHHWIEFTTMHEDQTSCTI